MYGCESWTINKTEHRRIDAFELWYWRRLLRVPWTARSSNQSVLKEINPEYSLERLMLKLQYFGPLMWSTDSRKRCWCWKNWRQEEKGMTEDEMVGWHHWSMNMSLRKLREFVMDREAWRAAVHGVVKNGHNWATELNWRSPELQGEEQTSEKYDSALSWVPRARRILDTAVSLRRGDYLSPERSSVFLEFTSPKSWVFITSNLERLLLQSLIFTELLKKISMKNSGR